jgi:endonuclease III
MTPLRANNILLRLKQLYPQTGPFLAYTTPWELMVAVQLSAQCTDERVNTITPKLFARYPTLDAYAKADPREFEQLIFSSGFYRNKTRNILAAASMVRDVFGGVLPRTMTEMLRIPGVARKTANVVLGNIYGVAEGIAVDTHVKRVARKLGLTEAVSPLAIERELMALFPQEEWFELTHRMILFGREYCTAKKHDHHQCLMLLQLDKIPHSL